MRHFSHEGCSLKQENICGEAKVIVKIDAAFFIVFQADYRDLI